MSGARHLPFDASERPQHCLQPRSGYATAAADPAASGGELASLGSTLVHSSGGLEVLVVILVLNVYKPRGMTRYGWRRDGGRNTRDER